MESPDRTAICSPPFTHDCQQALHSPAVTLDHLREFGSLGRHHADAVNDDIADFVYAVAHAEPPIDRDGCCTLGTHDLAHHNEPERIGPFPHHSQPLCLIICEPRPISHHHMAFQELLELLPLRLAGGPPIWVEDMPNR